MNILSFGSRSLMSQVDRIEDGFRHHGNQIYHHPKDCNQIDLIYCNDIGYWGEAVQAYSIFPDSKCILTILDLPLHLEDDYKKQIKKIQEVTEQFPEIQICSISNKVYNDLIEYCGVESKIIYQPIKDITNLNIPWNEREIDYLIVGRNHDAGKGHQEITIPTIEKMHGNISKLFTVGEGFVGAQNYGYIDDKTLNIIYNNAKYVFICGNFDGLGLSLIESQAAGAIPISYHWHPTAAEFIFKQLIFFSIEDIINFIQNTDKEKILSYINNTLYQKFCIDRFRKEKIAESILNLYHENKDTN